MLITFYFVQYSLLYDTILNLKSASQIKGVIIIFMTEVLKPPVFRIEHL